MHLYRILHWPRLAVIACGLLSISLNTGCMIQTHVAGQTLPSAYYLTDDIQYFPTGPENQLSNQIHALEQYKLEQLNNDAPVR